MDPPLINEVPFTAASNPSSYSLVELMSLPMRRFGGGSANGSLDESNLTEQNGGDGGLMKRRKYNFRNSSDDVSTSCAAAYHDLNGSNGKRAKALGFRDENGCVETEAGVNSGMDVKIVEEKSKPEPPKDYIHVRARRGQATDSHSLAERARRERISERMKILQDLVPGCNKVIGKAMVLDEIINYIQSLQGQVEFLSMKLEAITSRLTPTIEGFHPKDIVAPTFDANGMIFGLQAPRENSQGTQAEWLHMQIGSAFERAT